MSYYIHPQNNSSFFTELAQTQGELLVHDHKKGFAFEQEPCFFLEKSWRQLYSGVSFDVEENAKKVLDLIPKMFGKKNIPVKELESALQICTIVKKRLLAPKLRVRCKELRLGLIYQLANRHKVSSIVTACQNKCYKVALQLIQSGGKLEDANGYYDALFLEAYKREHYPLCLDLLACGAKLDHHKEEFLEIAIRQQHPASLDIIKAHPNLEWKSSEKGYSHLHLAVLTNQQEVVQALLEHGAPRNPRDEEL